MLRNKINFEIFRLDLSLYNDKFYQRGIFNVSTLIHVQIMLFVPV